MHEITAGKIKDTVSTYIAEFRSVDVDDIDLRIRNVSKQDSNIVVTGQYSTGFLDDWHSFKMEFDHSLNPIDIDVSSDEDD